MTTPVERYKSGDFNTCTMEHQPDGSYIYVLSKEGRDELDAFRARNLGNPDEQILHQAVVPEPDLKRATAIVREAIINERKGTD